MLLMWMGEQIDEYGIGSGASLIIMAGILARLVPTLIELGGAFKPQFGTIATDQMGIDKVVILVGLFVMMVVGIVLITQAQRRIPVQYAKRTRGIKVYGGQKSYIPLRVNQAGVIPIIFAQSILMFPGLLKSFDNSFLKTIGESFQREGFLYIVFYVGMIVFFCFFYTAIMFNPTETADRMKQYGNFIPGVRPGRKTAEFFEKVLTRVTLVGGISLAIIAIVPNFVMQFFKVNAMLAGFFGGTGLLIAVGVALDLVEKINSHLLMRQYEGFLKKGRIRGRR
jgi:preprotein translocase subunit SecY